tara:strand:- start:294 stop:524 length:231 start_codon:yes stop_codon:yes gene_type:complete
MSKKEENLELLSEHIHEYWMSWAKNLIDKETNISAERVKRWEKECFQNYSSLSEEMKEKDRKFARAIMKTFNIEKK